MAAGDLMENGDHLNISIIKNWIMENQITNLTRLRKDALGWEVGLASDYIDQYTMIINYPTIICQKSYYRF